MTREEASKILYHEWQGFLEKYVDYSGVSEAYKIAIKALEQEPCEDCISRQAVIKVLNTMDRYVSEELTLCDTNKKFPANEVFVVDDVYEEIAEQLPSVKQELKTEWIPVSERMPEEDGYYITTTLHREVYCDYWNGETFKRTEIVLAWMPLPEPYRGSEG